MRMLLSLMLAMAFFLDASAQKKKIQTANPIHASVAQSAMASLPNPTQAAATDSTYELRLLVRQEKFYAQMYEQAKGAAATSHSDTQWGYGINITVILAVVAIVLAVQIINLKDELEKLRQQVNTDVSGEKAAIRRDMNSIQKRILAALSRGHGQNLQALKDLNRQAEDKLTTKINEELQSIIGQLNSQAITRVANTFYGREENTITEDDSRALSDVNSKVLAIVVPLKQKLDFANLLKFNNPTGTPIEELDEELGKLIALLKGEKELLNSAYKYVSELLSAVKTQVMKTDNYTELERIMANIDRVHMNLSGPLGRMSKVVTKPYSA